MRGLSIELVEEDMFRLPSTRPVLQSVYET